jgi:hypothetical protein
MEYLDGLGARLTADELKRLERANAISARFAQPETAEPSDPIERRAYCNAILARSKRRVEQVCKKLGVK